MTRRPLRSAVLFVLALGLLSATAYLLQQSSHARPPLLVVAAPEAPPVGTSSVPRSAALSRSATRTPASGVPVVEGRWLRRTSSASGVPVVALQAYARAQLLAPASCHLGWTTLAGIGWVESQHGTLGHRTLQADGHSSPPVLGPALDGRDGLRAIAATAETAAMHGDTRWDHAVGPLQFIPSTWETWSADGDGDGVSDPNDIDDAARAAADYLCADGHDLATAEGWTAAVLSYNHAQAYLDAVHGAAQAYADRVD